MAGGRFWTTGEESQLRRMLALGVKYAVIARNLNRSYGAIHCRVIALRKHDIYPRLPRQHRKGELTAWVRKLSLAGVSDADVAGILGVTRVTVRSCRRRLGIAPGCPQHARRAAPQRADISNRAKFLRLYSGVGRSDSEIARLIGITKQSVRGIRVRFGLPGLGLPGVRGREI